VTPLDHRQPREVALVEDRGRRLSIVAPRIEMTVG
jgi:hypothetical protein